MKKNEKIMSRSSLSLETSPILYLLPAIIFMLAMVGYPIGRVIYLSFMESNLTRPELGTNFIGLKNYIDLFGSIEFWKTVGRTISWASISVVGKTLIGFLLAWLLSKVVRFRGLYMTILLIPWVTPMVVAGITWRWIYNTQFGMLNWILIKFNVLTEQYSWLGHKFSAFLSTSVVDMWIGIPFMAMILLAGLQSVPEDVLDASKIDGTSTTQRLRFIILPLMKPIILVSTTLSAIWTFNSFGVIWPMTKGGPENATQTLVVEAYKYSFNSFDLGVGATVAMFILIFLILFTTLHRYFLRQEEK